MVYLTSQDMLFLALVLLIFVTSLIVSAKREKKKPLDIIKVRDKIYQRIPFESRYEEEK